MRKKVIALLLAVFLCFNLAACKGNSSAGAQGDNQASGVNNAKINIAYNAADSFNPYTCKTVLNRNLSTLIYEPLIKVDSSFNTVNVLASGYSVNGNVLTVSLKNANFSDGSPVLADDVVYSFNLAKASGGVYAAKLTTVESAEIRDNLTVLFKLKNNDRLGINLLTFPVIKMGSDQLKNQDNVFLPPIGSGRYLLNAEQTALTYNGGWHGGNINIGTLNLINAPDSESLAHSVEIGAIDYYYTDLSDCNIIRMSGQRVNINLNNLVYLGLNLNSNNFSNAYMRHAISAAIGRTQICEQGYYNNALAATGIYNPVWETSKGAQTIENLSNLKIALENLAEIGYNRKDENGYFVNYHGNPITFNLLVNEENVFRVNAANLIREQLKAAGIKVNVNAVSYQRYIEILNAKSFDMYIGEVNITNNMDISSVVTAGGSVAYGIKPVKTEQPKNDETTQVNPNPESDEKAALQSVISLYFNGSGNIPDIAATAISEMPVIPICYRMGVLFCSDKIEVNNSACADDIFFNIENIKLK